MDWGTISENEREGWIDAAVLVPVYRDKGEDFLILTKRTEEVLHHKGQICFPGGAVDPEDKSLWETALRETEEELGVRPSQVQFMREMPKQYTPTGFRVFPFVGQIQTAVLWQPNPVEISEVLRIPFHHFLDEKNFQLMKKIWGGREFMDPHFLYEGHDIWGMTGRILCEFFGLPKAG